VVFTPSRTAISVSKHPKTPRIPVLHRVVRRFKSPVRHVEIPLRWLNCDRDHIFRTIFIPLKSDAYRGTIEIFENGCDKCLYQLVKNGCQSSACGPYYPSLFSCDRFDKGKESTVIVAAQVKASEPSDSWLFAKLLSPGFLAVDSLAAEKRQPSGSRCGAEVAFYPLGLSSPDFTKVRWAVWQLRFTPDQWFQPRLFPQLSFAGNFRFLNPNVQ